MTHPLYNTDREIVNRLISRPLEELTNEDITNAARLLIRYDGIPSCENLRGDIILALHKWNKTPNQLHIKSREIWQSGWRPGNVDQEEVGSGADVNAACGQ
tara:strand:+ start:4382 stop:4684 length:303 start_codon:yes stop_codon:yes gene_type:complete